MFHRPTFFGDDAGRSSFVLPRRGRRLQRDGGRSNATRRYARRLARNAQTAVRRVDLAFLRPFDLAVATEVVVAESQGTTLCNGLPASTEFSTQTDPETGDVTGYRVRVPKSTGWVIDGSTVQRFDRILFGGPALPPNDTTASAPTLVVGIYDVVDDPNASATHWLLRPAADVTDARHLTLGTVVPVARGVRFGRCVLVQSTPGIRPPPGESLAVTLDADGDDDDEDDDGNGTGQNAAAHPETSFKAWSLLHWRVHTPPVGAGLQLEDPDGTGAVRAAVHRFPQGGLALDEAAGGLFVDGARGPWVEVRNLPGATAPVQGNNGASGGMAVAHREVPEGTSVTAPHHAAAFQWVLPSQRGDAEGGARAFRGAWRQLVVWTGETYTASHLEFQCFTFHPTVHSAAQVVESNSGTRLTLEGTGHDLVVGDDTMVLEEVVGSKATLRADVLYQIVDVGEDAQTNTASIVLAVAPRDPVGKAAIEDAVEVGDVSLSRPVGLLKWRTMATLGQPAG